jgi:cytochrome c553
VYNRRFVTPRRVIRGRSRSRMSSSSSRLRARVSFLAAGSFAIALLVASAVGSVALAKRGDAKAGAEKVLACQACHGPSGNSTNPEWPSLAGQNAAYTAEQMKLFRAWHRNDLVMAAQAQAVPEDQDIADISAYFAAQTPVGLEADPSYWKAGEELYRGGDKARGIPACKACHGPVGRGNPTAGYPALRAQHAQYTVKQLTAYAADERYLDPNGSGQKFKSRNGHMMVTISKRLTAEDMRNLASYMQGMR